MYYVLFCLFGVYATIRHLNFLHFTPPPQGHTSQRSMKRSPKLRPNLRVSRTSWKKWNPKRRRLRSRYRRQLRALNMPKHWGCLRIRSKSKSRRPKKQGLCGLKCIWICDFTTLLWFEVHLNMWFNTLYCNLSTLFSFYYLSSLWPIFRASTAELESALKSIQQETKSSNSSLKALQEGMKVGSDWGGGEGSKTGSLMKISLKLTLLDNAGGGGNVLDGSDWGVEESKVFVWTNHTLPPRPEEVIHWSSVNNNTIIHLSNCLYWYI